MLKYGSHAAYCALLYTLLSRVETAALQQPAEDEPSTLVRFFRAFVYINITLLCAAVFVFDICGVRYSRLSDALAPPPLGLLLRGVFLYAMALAANVSLCLVGMWAHRVVFGFPLRYELAGSTALLVAYNAGNLWYNATASERLRPFWREKVTLTSTLTLTLTLTPTLTLTLTLAPTLAPALALALTLTLTRASTSLGTSGGALRWATWGWASACSSVCLCTPPRSPSRRPCLHSRSLRRAGSTRWPGRWRSWCC